MQRSSGKKVLQLVGDASETLETYVPFQTLQAVGVEVHAVCPDKKSGDHIHTAVHEMEVSYWTLQQLLSVGSRAVALIRPICTVSKSDLLEIYHGRGVWETLEAFNLHARPTTAKLQCGEGKLLAMLTDLY